MNEAKRRSRRDFGWITPVQAFTCTCWAALLVLCAVLGAMQPPLG